MEPKLHEYHGELRLEADTTLSAYLAMDSARLGTIGRRPEVRGALSIASPDLLDDEQRAGIARRAARRGGLTLAELLVTILCIAIAAAKALNSAAFGSAIVFGSPTFINRFGHNALCAQWLVVAMLECAWDWYHSGRRAELMQVIAVPNVAADRPNIAKNADLLTSMFETAIRERCRLFEIDIAANTLQWPDEPMEHGYAVAGLAVEMEAQGELMEMLKHHGGGAPHGAHASPRRVNAHAAASASGCRRSRSRWTWTCGERSRRRDCRSSATTPT